MDPFALLPLAVLAFFLIVAIFQWLWNSTMPQVFKLGEINFWQALRMLLISGFIFGSSQLPSFQFEM